MVRKILGYLFSIVGLAGLVYSLFPSIRALIALPLPEQLTDTVLLIVTLILIAIGVFLIMRNGKGKARQKSVEVPIYHKNEVVGYRRT